MTFSKVFIIVFRLEKRDGECSPAELKMMNERSEEEDLQRGSALSLQQMKRLHRQSTVSCDGNFATCSPTVAIGQHVMPERIPEGVVVLIAEHPAVRTKGPESPNRRKTSKNTNGGNHNVEDLVQEADDRDGSFMSNLRSQLKPINDWTSKWHCELMKSSTPLASSPGAVSNVETSSRNSLSVPSTPNQHQAFTFDEFPGIYCVHSKQMFIAQLFLLLETGIDPVVSRENSPGGKKHQQEHHSMETGNAIIKNNPVLLLNSISPEFRKKVEVWERLKSGLSAAPAFGEGGAVAAITPPTPTTPHGHTSKKFAESPDWSDIGKRRSEPDKLPPAFKKKLAEWEIRKAVAGKSDQNVEELHKILPHDFNRKLQEWERMKQQQQQQAAAGKVSPAVANQPVLERQGSGKQQQRGKHVKSAQKTEDGQQQRGEKQKEKDLQWLEKELQKIEREKTRLEREREKFIERESR